MDFSGPTHRAKGGFCVYIEEQRLIIPIIALQVAEAVFWLPIIGQPSEAVFRLPIIGQPSEAVFWLFIIGQAPETLFWLPSLVLTRPKMSSPSALCSWRA